MDDYPPTPSFGMAPSHNAQPYRDRSQHEIYDYGDLATEDRALLDYHRAQSNTAFQHNASNTPAFSASAVASSIPHPIYRERTPPPYTYSQDFLPQKRHLESRGSQKAYTSPQVQTLHEPSPDVHPNRDQILPHKLVSQAAEEGELSEGEFEETGIEVDTDTGHVFDMELRRSQPRNDRNVSVPRNAHRQTRDVAPRFPLTDMYGRSLNLNRQRSESYSPDEEAPSRRDYEPSIQRRNLSHRRQSGPSDHYDFDHNRRYRSRSPRDELMIHARDFTRDVSVGQRESVLVQSFTSYPREEPSRSTKSLADARKEAQHAILNLLPLKVRFHDYIEEGIDEEIVLRQFDSLGMASTTLQPPSSKPQVANRFNDMSNRSQSLTPSQGANVDQAYVSNAEASSEKLDRLGEKTLSEITPTATSAPSPRFTSQLNNSNTGEERKDRIARLLAERKQKQSPTTMNPDPANSLASANVAGLTKATPDAQAVAKADKEKAIRQKLEALQRSRDQRAKKASQTISTDTHSTSNQKDTDRSKELAQEPLNEAPSASPLNQSLIEPKPTSPAQLVGTQHMPSIPGLFLASGTNNLPNSADQGSGYGITQNVNPRKRPVASDFDEPQATGMLYKRPFGQSRNEKPLVIDVTDEESDEDEPENMEIVQNQDDLDLQNRTRNKSGTPKPRAARDLPPLSDFPPRRPFILPNSATSTPPALQQTSKMSVVKPEDLEKKEKEIQEMRKRIAEFELRKKAKQNLSGTQTPVSNNSTSSPAKSGNGTGVAERISSVEIERLIDSASRQVNQDQQKLAEVGHAEQTKANELRQSEAEQRRLRRAKIATTLPVVDAEVENARKRLADLRAEMAKMEAAVQHGLTEKRRLAEEMERLGLEGDDEPINDHNDQPKELQVVESVEKIASHVVSDRSATIIATPPATARENTSQTQEPISEAKSEMAFVLANTSEMINADDEKPSTPLVPQLPITSSGHGSELSTGVHTLHISSPEPQPLSAVSGNISRTTFPETSELAALQSPPEVSMDNDSEMVDSFAPDPKALTPPLTKRSTKKETSSKRLNDRLDELYNNAEGESDTYEPPGATPPLGGSLVSPDSSPFSPAPPGGIPIIDVDMQHDDLPIDSIDRGSVESFAPNETISLPVQQADQAGNIDHHSAYYTPYESPLRYFRAYRFHPSFKQEVKGSFKSLTYSHKIRVDQEFCRYELAGGVCNDASCEFQHFRDVELADNVILVELGNSTGYSEEEKPRWIVGLRTVLQAMRKKNTVDFEVIASQIIAHRTAFLEDASRVLPLGGITVYNAS